MTEYGLEYEVGQTPAEVVMKDLDISEDSKGVVAPGTSTGEGEGGRAREGRERRESICRAVAVSGNYLDQDKVASSSRQRRFLGS